MLSHRPVATQQDSSLCIYAATSPDPTRHNHTRTATLTRCERQLFIANICRGRCSRSTGATGQGPTTVNHVLIEEHGCTVSHTPHVARRPKGAKWRPCACLQLRKKLRFIQNQSSQMPVSRTAALANLPADSAARSRVEQASRTRAPASPNIILQTSFPLASPPPLAALLPPSRGNRPSHQKGL